MAFGTHRFRLLYFKTHTTHKRKQWAIVVELEENHDIEGLRNGIYNIIYYYVILLYTLIEYYNLYIYIYILWHRIIIQSTVAWVRVTLYGVQDTDILH